MTPPRLSFAGEMDSDAGPSRLRRRHRQPQPLSGAPAMAFLWRAARKPKSNPQFKLGFEGLNLYQQRYARGGNQFTVEAARSGACAWAMVYVVEAVKRRAQRPFSGRHRPIRAARQYRHETSSGGAPREREPRRRPETPSSATGPRHQPHHRACRAQFVTDPSCLYDAATQRFFVTVLTLETNPNGSFTLVNHLDTARQATALILPALGPYTRVDVTKRWHQHRRRQPWPLPGRLPAHRGRCQWLLYHHQCLSLVLQRLRRGADLPPSSKAQMAAAAASVTMVHLDTSGAV